MKQKHYIYQQGGLGNQLYILAYAFYLKEKGVGPICMYSADRQKKDTKDKKKRNVYSQITERLGFPISGLSYFFFSMAKKMAKKSFFKKYIALQVEKERKFAVFQEPCTEYESKIYLHMGWYQSYLYQTSQFIERLYKIIEELAGNTRQFYITENDVVLHIRRGDFLKEKNRALFHIIETPHYLEGLAKLSQGINLEKVYILSDDFEGIEDIITTLSKQYEVVLVKGNTVLQDLYLLTQFKNYVIGNSTFSWWGAYLSKYKERANIIVPKEPWKIPMPEKSPYPPYWVQI